MNMDDSIANTATGRNEATLCINLDGATNITLNFWTKEYGDESHGPPSTPFTNSANFDGVAISEDGILWYEVVSLRGIGATYVERTLDVDAAVVLHGLTYDSDFHFRFNQYDNFPIPSDGIGIDDISITGTYTSVGTTFIQTSSVPGLRLKYCAASVVVRGGVIE